MFSDVSEDVTRCSSFAELLLQESIHKNGRAGWSQRRCLIQCFLILSMSLITGSPLSFTEHTSICFYFICCLKSNFAAPTEGGSERTSGTWKRKSSRKEEGEKKLKQTDDGCCVCYLSQFTKSQSRTSVTRCRERRAWLRVKYSNLKVCRWKETHIFPPCAICMNLTAGKFEFNRRKQPVNRLYQTLAVSNRCTECLWECLCSAQDPTELTCAHRKSPQLPHSCTVQSNRIIQSSFTVFFLCTPGATCSSTSTDNVQRVYVGVFYFFLPVLVAGDPVRDVGDGLTVTLFVPEAAS